MSIVLTAQRLSLILRKLKKDPSTLRNKSGGYLGSDYLSDGDKSYSEMEIKIIKNKLKKIAPRAYDKIYTEKI